MIHCKAPKLLSQIHPNPDANGGNTLPKTKSPNPNQRAATMGSQRSVLSTHAAGERRWNRAMTRGAAKIQITATSSVIFQKRVAPLRKARTSRD